MITHRFFNLKLALNLCVVLLTFAACFLDIFLLHFLLPEQNTPASFSIRSRKSFVFDQETAFFEKRNNALSEHIPIFRYFSEDINEARANVEQFVAVINEHNRRTASNREAIRDYYLSVTGVRLSLTDIDNLTRYKDIEKLVEGILTIKETILRQLIVEDINDIKHNQTIQVMYADPRDRVTYSINSLMTVDEVLHTFKEQVSHIYWQVPQNIRNPIMQICELYIRANLKFDEEENNQRLSEILTQYPSYILHFNPGDVLIPFRKIITDEDIALLKTYLEVKKNDYWLGVPWVLLFIVMAMGLYQPVISRYIAVEFRKKPSFTALLTILLITLIMFKLFMLLTPFPVVGFPFYVLPFLIILLNHENLAAFWTCITAALLIGLICGNLFSITILFLFGGFTAILTFTPNTHRIKILYPSLVVGCFSAVFIISLNLYKGSVTGSSGVASAASSVLQSVFTLELFHEAKYGFIGGMLSGPIALIILPFLELSRYNVSSFKLKHFMDLQHPIMRDLLTKTPGTYQHTMTVAYLAQSVGEAIGLNIHILRVGAYYHDIGKTLKPNLFVENQFSGKNPHNELDPIKSTEIIHQHIKDGVKICQNAGLPQVIIDMIIQHHGTLPVEFFYNEACKSGIDINKNEFRYTGPKPQTIEAAVLMIVDAIEAASRTLHEPNRKDIRNLVHTIISKRISDRQFDECDLTTRNIATIIQTLIEALEASFHSRVEYPWQKEKKEKTVSAASAEPASDSNNHKTLPAKTDNGVKTQSNETRTAQT